MASIHSMTGFARFDGALEGDSWVWELRSVNNKGLDLRIRLPHGFDSLDPVIRKAVSNRFKRGSFQISLQLTLQKRESRTEVNEEILAQVLELSDRLQKDRGLAPLSTDGLLSIRGVLDQVEQEESVESRDALVEALTASLDKALAQLEQSRYQEGQQLRALAEDFVQQIDDLRAEAASLDAVTPGAIRDRLQSQIKELLGKDNAFSEERLAQEVAVLTTKADIREELDRLAAHVETARELIAGGGACGRRLDFLCQEFNREANTLCSKSADVQLTRLGIDLKARIEQLREQIQNIE
ncbi:YicC/YloC family endoribonuclease [Kiloniella sp. b19]|uniref:YicC/YloC family endoribonuclease n=1 Tax=Kiloniella sp. GXU_MW_B19 TaxID=3141326 RepID=UPI0031DE1866